MLVQCSVYIIFVFFQGYTRDLQIQTRQDSTVSVDRRDDISKQSGALSGPRTETNLVFTILHILQ